MHTGRTARNHLLAQAATTGIARSRVDEVIDMVGLSGVASRRAGRFSLGMRWVRTLLKDLARQGRTVLLSSHLMMEMALTADRVVIIGQGRLLRDQSMADFVAEAWANVVTVRSPQASRLRELIGGPDVTVACVGADRLEVRGLGAEQIGAAAAQAGLTLFELTPQAASLEDAYMALTEDTIDYRSRPAVTPDADPARSAA